MLKHNYNVAHTDDPYSQICFELLGLDVLVDENLKVHLLEVNHAPSFACDTKVDEAVKSRLITDTFAMLNVSKLERQRLIDLKNKQKKNTLETGRREHLNQGEFRETCLNERLEYLASLHTDFERVFPSFDQEESSLYQRLFDQAEENYQSITGVSVFQKPKPMTPWVSKNRLFESNEIPKSINLDRFQLDPLEKIYGGSKRSTSFMIKVTGKKTNQQLLHKKLTSQPIRDLSEPNRTSHLMPAPSMRGHEPKAFDNLLKEFKKQIDLRKCVRTQAEFEGFRNFSKELSIEHSRPVKNYPLNSSFGSREAPPRKLKPQAQEISPYKAGKKSPYSRGLRISIQKT